MNRKRRISTVRGSRGQSGGGTRQRGLTAKLHLAVDAHGMPVRMLAMAGTVADCTQTEALLDGIEIDRIETEHLLADRGYDTNAALAAARARGMDPALPPKRNRKVAREYDVALYQARHLVGSGFSKLKERRGVATRYAKNAASFLAICRIRALALWAKII